MGGVVGRRGCYRVMGAVAKMETMRVREEQALVELAGLK